MITMVTGASGFLGSKLTLALLNEGYIVKGVDKAIPPNSIANHPNIRWIQRDLNVEGLSLEDVNNVEILFHLAGATFGAGEDESIFLATNEAIMVNILKVCAGRVGKIIYASSQYVYGNVDGLAIDESLALNGYDSAYGCSKLNCENWIKWFHKKKSGAYILFRLTGFVEGGGIIDYIIDQAKQNNPIELFSEGNICRDYLAINDGINAFIAAAKYNKIQEGIEVFNIGSGQAIKTIDLAKIICQEVGSSSRIVPISKAALRQNFVYNISKARNLLGFNPISLDKAVQLYVKTKMEKLNHE